MPDSPVKYAVASKDGISINEHFGHARRFGIYALTAESCELLEERQVEHYCHGNSGSQSAMAMILETISDCDAVFVARIGDGPTEKLAAIGVEAVSDYAYEAVVPSLLEHHRNKTCPMIKGE